MSGMMGLPPGAPPGMPPGAPPGPPQGMGPPGMGQPPMPPGMKLNPAYVAWQQQAQQVQAVIAKNAQLQQQFDDAVALLKRDGINGFRLDIETDSTIAPDENAEKQARIEFMQQFVPLFQQIVPVAQGNPAMADLAKQITLFAVRGFSVSRPIEESIEQAFDAIGKMPPQQPPGAKQGPTQNPAVEMAKVEADKHDTDTKAAASMAQTQQKQQQALLDYQARMAALNAEHEKSQAEMMMRSAELAQKHEIDQMNINQRAADQSLRGLV